MSPLNVVISSPLPLFSFGLMRFIYRTCSPFLPELQSAARGNPQTQTWVGSWWVKILPSVYLIICDPKRWRSCFPFSFG